MRVGKVNQAQQPKKTSTAKKVAIGTVATIATAAATGATILVLAKKGKLNPTEGGNKYVELLKADAKQVADKAFTVVDDVTTRGGKAVNSFIGRARHKAEQVKAHFSPKNNPNVSNFQAKFGEFRKEAAATVTTVKENAKTIYNNIKARVNTQAAKFNPDLATAADKAAETFNNFVK